MILGATGIGQYVIPAVAALVGVGLGALVMQILALYRKNAALREADRLVEEAKIESQKIRNDAEIAGKNEVIKLREELEAEIRSERSELKSVEKRLSKREDGLDEKFSALTKKEEQLDKTQERLQKDEEKLQERFTAVQESIDAQEKKLLEIAGYSREQAEEELFKRLDGELEDEIARRLERATQRAKDLADEEATKIVAQAVDRLAIDYTTTAVVTSVELPNDEMKGRIIGREGRNIRSFEKATGIDVIVDDTPGVVVLSGFDSVRREIARQGMEKLVADGRIHPSRIEEVVSKTQEDMERHLIEVGKETATELDVKNLKPREVFLLGRLKFRASYGQNVLDHSREVGWLSGILAAELKLDENLARRAGLLHDIGKGVDHEEEGTHPQIGVDIAKRCDEPEEVCNAIAAHHEDVEATSLYAVIVKIADGISAARPGARRETLEKYVKRLEKLEAIASSHLGVDKAYAIQAGREVRVIAKPDQLSDKDSHRVAREIAQEIENELSYPGEIKITLIRENRFIEYAR